MYRLIVFACLLQFCAGAQRSIAPSQDASLTSPGFASLFLDQKTSTPSGPTLSLDQVEAIALTENPEIHLAARRVAMAQAHVPVAGTLDDPQFMYRGWGVPLTKPWDLNAAQNMFMISQALAGPGKRSIEQNIARSDITQAQHELDSARLKVRVEVQKAFYDLLLAQDELQIHNHHVDIARQAIEAARIKYTVGKVPQQDILKAQLAMTRLAEHMIRFDRDAEIARARLNTLLGRDPTTPIQIQGDYAVAQVLPSAESLEKLAVASRPDLLAAQVAVEKSREEHSLTQKAYTPDFSVSGGYMLMPTGTNPRNDYMVEGSVSLPWLNRHKHDAEVAESTAKVTEQDAELEAMRSEAYGQIQEALAEAQAAQGLAAVYGHSLRPQAESTLHAAIIAYENNQTELLDLLDSQMTVIDVDLSWRQAMGEFSTRLADLELAVGAPIELNSQVAQEEKQ